MEILVASESSIKRNAFKTALADVLSPFEINVTAAKATSGINEQPVEFEETYRGATNRLQDAKRICRNKKFDLVGSVENGIYSKTIDEKTRWYDFAWVLLESKKGKLVARTSVSVELPLLDVQEAMQRGFETTTVGSIIAERLNCDPQDPHNALTNGLYPREKILIDAIKVCAGQLRI